MPRRIYTPTLQRIKLQQEAMSHMRAAREAIDPALLNRARELILNGDRSPGAQTAGDEKIDPVRTLTLIKEYLTLMKDNKNVCSEIRTLLTKN